MRCNVNCRTAHVFLDLSQQGSRLPERNFELDVQWVLYLQIYILVKRETQVPCISHRRSVGGRGLRFCPVPYLNTEIKFCVGKTSPTMPNLNWLHCKLLFHSILLFIS
jgi:hypothetical protein